MSDYLVWLGGTLFQLGNKVVIIVVMPFNIHLPRFYIMSKIDLIEITFGEPSKTFILNIVYSV